MYDAVQERCSRYFFLSTIYPRKIMSASCFGIWRSVSSDVVSRLIVAYVSTLPMSEYTHLETVVLDTSVSEAQDPKSVAV